MADKKVVKKLTFEELIAKKIEKDKNQVKFIEIEVPSMDGTLLFERPLEEDLITCLDSVSDGKTTESVLSAYDTLIYTCCAYLKDTKLHEQFEIKNPKDVVKTMLEINDRLLIGNALLEFSGLNKLGAKIKK